MSLFAISDLHLSFGTNKSMECFNGWEDYTNRLKKNWNAVVEPDDTVVIVGDVSWAMSFDELLPDFNFINNELNGRKIIIKGNHDYWWNTLTSMQRFIESNKFNKISILNNNSYTCCGISICGSRGWQIESETEYDKKILNREIGRITMSINSAETDNKILFLHYPPFTNINETNEILNLAKSNNIKRCFYGHIHGKASNYMFQGETSGINFKLISADTMNFTPYLIFRS